MKGTTFRGGRYTAQASPELRELIARRQGQKQPEKLLTNGASNAFAEPSPRLAPYSARSGQTASDLPATLPEKTCQNGATEAGIIFPDKTTRDGVRTRSQDNVRAFLKHAGATLSYDGFVHNSHVSRNGETRELDDDLERELWLEADQLGLASPREFFREVLENEARKNTVHPVREYLDGLKWDKVPRIDSFLTEYLGAENTPLNCAISRKTLITAVRRVFQPGCKKDEALILEGPQGAGKTTAIEALFSERWYTDSLQIGSDPKETIEQTSSAWGVEFSELAGLTRRDIDTVKAMVSRREDRARLSYARRAVTIPRQFVLIGTINAQTYLQDNTGNRRFWIVRVGKINLAGIKKNRDQIWAEARHYEKQLESLMLPPELWQRAADEAEQRTLTDPWFDVLHDALTDAESGEIPPSVIEVSLIWRKLGVDVNRQDGAVGRRVASAMNILGFTRKRGTHASTKARLYVYTNCDLADPATVSCWRSEL